MAQQAIRGQMTGLQDALKRLENVKRGTKNKLLRKGVDKASAGVEKEVKARTPQLSGLAKKSIGRRVKTYRGGSSIVGIIGPRTGFKKAVTIALTKQGVRGALSGTKKAGSLARRAQRSVERMQDPVRYFHMIERGRKLVRAKNKRVLSSGAQIFGTQAGPVAGQHPLERSWQAQSGQASETVRSVLETGIQDLARAA